MQKKQNCGKCFNFNYEYLYSSYNKLQIHWQVTKLTVDFKFKLSVFYKLAYKNTCAISKQQTKNGIVKKLVRTKNIIIISLDL